MKISIITVCYNGVDTIRDTIESVLAQQYKNIEYIIVDGASKDGTLDIISEYEGRIAKVISEPDKGIYDAMNKGVWAATGDYVGILNSDDFFAGDNVIQDLVVHLQNNPDADATYADLVFVQRKQTDVVTRKYSSAGFSPWKIRFGFMIPHPTFYARRELFQRFGDYKLGYRVSADFELMARFFSKNVKMVRQNAVMVKMRDGGISTTGFWWRIHQNLEIVRACKENGIYTNILLVAMKVPFKLASYLRK
ncbi:Glycosyltransferase involved in cell wall bisynthesis [Pseudomonas sp. NFACC48-1]|nr:Glycosyltransferase involved in cell wall bisynthesis [Pseudomonas sp. NFACC44-2]SDA75536.1 Glycosyltransferase involved in cell wall bisynthesis [Pseudomonas sp. NFACC51]SEJ31304.1 Glycosyltransferase involved in cell wall bisynthesis [Pseudomonas sp. NFACC07-1]SFH43445.1 Glycosyltransferase involved in cell wall bisynthesis [Pseudomonas sp. NFACC54]SFT15469.1 Glycosyltransferase involved in cell wall bisynthesis [Pseudomonas sp. NFACC48-1]